MKWFYKEEPKMEFTFDLEANLRFSHKALPINGYNNAYIKIVGDDELDGDTTVLLFKNSHSNTAPSTRSFYMDKPYVQKFENVNMKFGVEKNPFFRTKNTEGKIKTDSKLLFYVFATHLNSMEIPIHGFVGCGLINIFEAFGGVNKKNLHKPLRHVVSITNRDTNIGELNITFKNRVIISGQTKVCVVGEVERKKDTIKTYAYREFEVVKSLKKVWSGVDKMMDLFWFSVFSNSIPVAFSCQKNVDITEEGMLIILFYSLRRFSIENNVTINYKVPSTQSLLRGLSVKHKNQILSTLLSLLSFSKTYSFDYYMKNGKKESVETFMNASEGVADCEDFAKEICNLFRTLREMSPKNETLRELVCLCKLYISGSWLFRSTVANLNMSTGQVESKRHENIEVVSKISSLIERRMYLCQGSKFDVAAHMTVILLPINVFLKRLSLDKRTKMNSCSVHKTRIRSCKNCSKMEFITKAQELELRTILKKMNHEFNANLQEYQRLYDQNLTADELEIVVCEGTGEFDATNSSDDYLTIRRSILKSTKSFEFGKYKIFHPTYDPEQFFLNAISFVTPHFLREYNFPVSTFFCTYDSNIYSITFVDLVEHGEYNLIPAQIYNKEEMLVIKNVCKRQISQSSLKTLRDLSFENLEDVKNRMTSGGIKVSDLFDFSNIKMYGERDDVLINSNELLMFTEVLKECEKIKEIVNKEKAKQTFDKPSQASLLYTCSPQMFYISGFIDKLANGLIYNKYVIEIDFFHELYGSLLKNIVFVVKI